MGQEAVHLGNCRGLPQKKSERRRAGEAELEDPEESPSDQEDLK